MSVERLQLMEMMMKKNIINLLIIISIYVVSPVNCNAENIYNVYPDNFITFSLDKSFTDYEKIISYVYSDENDKQAINDMRYEKSSNTIDLKIPNKLSKNGYVYIAFIKKYKSVKFINNLSDVNSAIASAISKDSKYKEEINKFFNGVVVTSTTELATANTKLENFITQITKMTDFGINGINFDNIETILEINKIFNDKFDIDVEIFNFKYKTEISNIVDIAISLRQKFEGNKEMFYDFLSNQSQDEYDNNLNNGYFGALRANDQLKLLSGSGFDSEFISTFRGKTQHVNLGVGTIFLLKTKETVVSPIIRIFLDPRSYYEPRARLFNSKLLGCIYGECSDTLKYLTSIVRKTDLNFGYTTTSSKNNENTNYIIAGISYEINRSALFNIGYAFPSNNETNGSGQWYSGFTVDSNFLREIGLLEKE